MVENTLKIEFLMFHVPKKNTAYTCAGTAGILSLDSDP